jgi:uncharacterized protein
MQPLCVFCRRHPAEPEWRPFCSERCKIQDLARWADGGYRVEGEPLSDPDPSQLDANRKSEG